MRIEDILFRTLEIKKYDLLQYTNVYGEDKKTNYLVRWHIKGIKPKDICAYKITKEEYDFLQEELNKLPEREEDKKDDDLPF